LQYSKAGGTDIVVDLRGRVLLVVDDDPILVELLVSLCELTGARVYSAPNGSMAMKMVKELPIDLVISDLKMQKGDGISFLRSLRTGQFREIPFILLTGLTHLNVDQIKELGAQDVVFKPFDLEDFTKRIASVLDSFEGFDHRSDPSIMHDFKISRDLS
jgi:CheY-like chemotaxis protein